MSGNTHSSLMPNAPYWYFNIPNYDGLEIAPVAEYNDEYGTYCERTTNSADAHYWSVYGHLAQGHTECLEDFTTEEEAQGFANDLLRNFSNLRIHGISYHSTERTHHHA